MSSDVLEGWRTHRLDELSKIKRGASPRPIQDPRWFAESGHGWVRISDVTRSDRVLRATTQYLSDEGRRASVAIQPGDLIMSICATIGRPLFSGIDACIHDGFVAFKDIRTDLIEPEYLYHFLKLSEPHFDSLSQPGTQKNLNSKLVGGTRIDLPPLSEQRRIVDVLRSIDDAVAANRASLAHMSRVRAATLFAAFEESDWEPARLGDLGRWSSGGTPSKADETLWDGDVPWICPRDMKSPVVTRAQNTVSEKAIGGSCRLVPKGTLLLVVRGMILAKAIPTATTAMCATHNQDIKAFQPNGQAIPKFVQLCLQHQEHNLLQQINTATHGTKKLDSQTIANIEIPLPPLPTQIELSETISDIDSAIVQAGEEHIRLSVMRAAIQSDLLSGRVRVPA